MRMTPPQERPVGVLKVVNANAPRYVAYHDESCEHLACIDRVRFEPPSVESTTRYFPRPDHGYRGF